MKTEQPWIHYSCITISRIVLTVYENGMEKEFRLFPSLFLYRFIFDLNYLNNLINNRRPTFSVYANGFCIYFHP